MDHRRGDEGIDEGSQVNRQWLEYDETTKASQGQVPMRAELHDINAHRGHDRQSDR